jgi:transposase
MEAMPKRFPPECKADVVRVARRADLSMVEVAADFEVSVESVKRWKRRADIDEGIKDGLTSAEQADAVPMRREIRRLEMGERDPSACRRLVRQRHAPTMMYPLVRELAVEGFPVTVTC